MACDAFINPAAVVRCDLAIAAMYLGDVAVLGDAYKTGMENCEKKPDAIKSVSNCLTQQTQFQPTPDALFMRTLFLIGLFGTLVIHIAAKYKKGWRALFDLSFFILLGLFILAFFVRL